MGELRNSLFVFKFFRVELLLLTTQRILIHSLDTVFECKDKVYTRVDARSTVFSGSFLWSSPLSFHLQCVCLASPALPPHHILCCPVALRDRVACSCPHLISSISIIHTAEQQHDGAILMLSIMSMEACTMKCVPKGPLKVESVPPQTPVKAVDSAK